MHLTIEISLYPLTSTYKDEVLRFLDLLAAEGLEPKVNALSTQIQGPSTTLWPALGRCIEAAFAEGRRGALVMKVLPGIIDLNYQHPQGDRVA
jgi:uncharacterized protein YqgV (UPF0045/DUF77 family)